MRIAAFNVENLFDRAKAFNTSDEAETTRILDASAELNSLFEKPAYSDADKARMLTLMAVLDLEKSDRGEFVILRQIRERIVRRPRGGGPNEITKDGRDDWIGWVELKTEPVNEIAISNTGRVIRDVDADILAVVEAEDRVALKLFADIVLDEVGGDSYQEVMVIDGNDQRGIDVGLMTKRGNTIALMQSHIHDLKPDGEPIFSRDCPKYEVITPQGEVIWVLPNHFKSKYGGNDPRSRAKRMAQAQRVAELYEELIASGKDKVVVLGDLNDTPDSVELAPLLANTDLRDVSEHPTFDTGEFKGREGTNERGYGTIGLGNDSQKIDYLLLSPVLFNRVQASGLFRKGAWPGSRPPRWTVYPELKRPVHVASDHHVIWADIADPMS